MLRVQVCAIMPGFSSLFLVVVKDQTWLYAWQAGATATHHSDHLVNYGRIFKTLFLKEDLK